jgi:hypothetical protein
MRALLVRLSIDHADFWICIPDTIDQGNGMLTGNNNPFSSDTDIQRSKLPYAVTYLPHPGLPKCAVQSSSLIMTMGEYGPFFCVTSVSV